MHRVAVCKKNNIPLTIKNLFRPRDVEAKLININGINKSIYDWFMSEYNIHDVNYSVIISRINYCLGKNKELTFEYVFKKSDKIYKSKFTKMREKKVIVENRKYTIKELVNHPLNIYKFEYVSLNSRIKVYKEKYGKNINFKALFRKKSTFLRNLR